MFRLGTIASSGGGRTEVNLVISADTDNYDIYANRGGSYVAGESDVTLTINSGVVVGSTSIATNALQTGSSWTAGDTITIVNNGTVTGKGGNGGVGGDADNNSGVKTTTSGTDGEDGGDAFLAQFATSFTNNGAVYGGGGGGGGAGGDAQTITGKISRHDAYGGGGGGGGAGDAVGSGGAGGIGTATGALIVVDDGDDGLDGTSTNGGAGGSGGFSGSSSGGAGGNVGQDGASGANGDATGGAGGTRGFYEKGQSFINSGAGVGGTTAGRSS
jgi:hypothetical protein